MSVIDGLRKTKRGQLHYDKTWLEQGKIQSILEECSSPPQLQGISPKEARIDKTTENYGNNQRVQFQTSTPKSSKGDADCLIPKITAIDHVIKSVEDKWDSQAKEKYEDRKKHFEQHTAMLLQQAENQLIQLCFHQEKKTKQLILQAEAKEKLSTEEVKKKQLKLKEHHKQHARLLDARLLEAHKKKKEDEENQRKRNIETRQKLIAMGKIQQEINMIKQNVEQNLASCRYLKYIPEASKNSGELMAHIQEKVNSLIHEATNEESTEKVMQTLLQLQGNAKNVYDFVHAQIEAANKRGAEEEAEKEKKKQEELKKKLEEEQKQQQKNNKKAATADLQSGSAVSSLLTNQNDTENIYKGYKTIAENVLKSCDPLMDANNKKIKFELQKAVNIPVNAISRKSGSHLREMLSRLCSLLSGQPVEISGKKVSTHIHPAGFTFVKDLLAKKIVKQGEEQVSSRMESAFPIAAVAVGIWSEFTDVGEMLLAHFFQKCPYLVPYYIPQVQGQSDENYYRALGYNYDASQLEPQSKFLKRMTGIMHLYAAILISSPPPKGGHQPHPHSIEHGWIWLTRVMNLDPIEDITATMVHSFLTVAGHSLMQVYGKQFQKLLKIMKEGYLPKIKAVSTDGAGGPVTRLEVLLDKCTNTGHIDSPKGVLPSTFWMS